MPGDKRAACLSLFERFSWRDLPIGLALGRVNNNSQDCLILNKHHAFPVRIMLFKGKCDDGERKMLKNILVVEDEPASLECIGHFLRKEGYRITEARDGVQAIKLIEKSRFDLVLTDVRMPRLDGVALATHILSKLPTIPIIMMTAFPSEDLRPIWGYGIPCLSKPLSLDELRTNVQRALY